MAESHGNDEHQGGPPSRWKDLPPLSERLARSDPVVLVGTALWALAFLVLLVLNLTTSAELSTLVWTALSGSVLGLMGYGVMWWQRRARQRGSRTAQVGA
ncbi:MULTISPECIES: DUF2530 domain-containing protein [Actinoalloteichus]|uniref:DUF2530 domain-containing protein n=1 Tax=Actinoalloteichus caeruleus DSM 43889 TaxID=1120930 RepID=A0ABT1JJN1_ACTCY|nr:DUF2530 domain-containing protein [Actinoalloteichus caeruleus]MCP2332537.1 Protein of unknown function (DUF2530) [Actinoalloteichus caeruleus DSM 43889]